MNAALGFGLRDTLHPMRPGLEFQARVDAATDHTADDFAITTMLALIFAHGLDLPALTLGVAAVHAQQVAGKYRRLIPAGSGADLEEYVAFIERVARDQQLVQQRFALGQ